MKRPSLIPLVGPSPLPLHQKLELVVKAVAKSLRRKRKAPRQRCGRHEGLRTGRLVPAAGWIASPDATTHTRSWASVE
ncbi:hypothetical protein Taro_013255 [Colocasia esculenta]|uniref:Uncharacterized protein n=1 Tax=Colocasia esculenta TaxID=4460 RepID=A0A843U632_COLES|nr:hypothetical protein [Colocasia esculenta]